MPDQTRRQFILLAGGAAGATAAWTVFGAPSVDSELFVLDAALRELVSSGAFSTELGEQYLADRSASTETGREFQRFVDSMPRGLSSADLSAAIRKRVTRDFEEGALCRLDGWHLSRTECRLAAVAHLYLLGGGRIAAIAENGDGPLAHLPNTRFGKVERWGPPSTEVGTPFNVQTSGGSALWFHFSELETLSYEIFVGSHATRTVVRHSELFAVANLTERQAKDLVSRTGSHPVHLVEPNRGKQLIGRFHVQPKRGKR